jgi:hypothetical protein
MAEVMNLGPEPEERRVDQLEHLGDHRDVAAPDLCDLPERAVFV